MFGGDNVAKYLGQFKYTPAGLESRIETGFAASAETLKNNLEAAGGSLDAVYWMWGEADVLIISDVPDEATAIGGALATALNGQMVGHWTPLLTAEQVDAGRAWVQSQRG